MNIDTELIITGLLSIVIAISLHEMMHAWVGYLLGDDTAKRQGRISLNPLVHIDIFLTVIIPFILLLRGLPPIGAAKPVPFNPHRLRWGEYGMALVALAGPLTNLMLAILSSLAYRFITGYDFLTLFFEIFTIVNSGFFIFNMLPIPPLDGSRVLYVLAPDSVRRFMDILERIGIFVILLLFVVSWPLIRPLLEDMKVWLLERPFRLARGFIFIR